MESRFFEPPMETKIGAEIEEFEKSRVKLLCLSEEWKATFGSSCREVRKNGGLRNRNFTVV